MVPKTGTHAIKRGAYIHQERALDISGNCPLALSHRPRLQTAFQPKRDNRCLMEKVDNAGRPKVGGNRPRTVVSPKIAFGLIGSLLREMALRSPITYSDITGDRLSEDDFRKLMDSFKRLSTFRLLAMTNTLLSFYENEDD